MQIQCNRARRSRHRISDAAKGTKVIIAKPDELSAETKRLESLCQRKLAELDKLQESQLHQAFAGQLTQDQERSAMEAATHD